MQARYGKTMVALLCLAMLAACGKSYEEKKQQTRENRLRQMREDSLALKVAVMPTLDCLPLFVAKERGLFDSLKVDVRLKLFNAQMDCDQALLKQTVEGGVTDSVRVAHMQKQGLEFVTFAKTNAYWLLVANKMARIKRTNQLQDKMVAMTRHSATDYLTDEALRGMKNAENVFRIQVNDVNVRLEMLLNNEMDAMWLTEPYATEATLKKHNILSDSRKMRKNLGEIVFLKERVSDERRTRQMELFTAVYNMACDSLNTNGLLAYRDVMRKYYKVSDNCMKALPRMNFIKSTTQIGKQ